RAIAGDELIRIRRLTDVQGQARFTVPVTSRIGLDVVNADLYQDRRVDIIPAGVTPAGVTIVVVPSDVVRGIVHAPPGAGVSLSVYDSEDKQPIIPGMSLSGKNLFSVSVPRGHTFDLAILCEVSGAIKQTWVRGVRSGACVDIASN